MTAISRRQLFAMGAAAAVAPVLPAIASAEPMTGTGLMIMGGLKPSPLPLQGVLDAIMAHSMDEVERAYTDAVMFGRGTLRIGDRAVHIRLPPSSIYLEPDNG